MTIIYKHNVILIATCTCIIYNNCQFLLTGGALARYAPELAMAINCIMSQCGTYPRLDENGKEKEQFLTLEKTGT